MPAASEALELCLGGPRHVQGTTHSGSTCNSRGDEGGSERGGEGRSLRHPVTNAEAAAACDATQPHPPPLMISSWRASGLLPILLRAAGLNGVGPGLSPPLLHVSPSAAQTGEKWSACTLVVLWQGAVLAGVAAVQLITPFQGRLLAVAVTDAGLRTSAADSGADTGGMGGDGIRWGDLFDEDDEEPAEKQLEGRSRLLMRVLERALASAGISCLVAPMDGSLALVTSVMTGGVGVRAASEDISAGTMHRVESQLVGQVGKSNPRRNCPASYAMPPFHVAM